MRLAILLTAALFAATSAAAQTPPPVAPVAPVHPPMSDAARAARSAMREACAADRARLCASAQPGEGKPGQCLKAHKAELSEGCRTAVMNMRAARAAGGASGMH